MSQPWLTGIQNSRFSWNLELIKANFFYLNAQKLKLCQLKDHEILTLKIKKKFQFQKFLSLDLKEFSTHWTICLYTRCIHCLYMSIYTVYIHGLCTVYIHGLYTIYIHGLYTWSIHCLYTRSIYMVYTLSIYTVYIQGLYAVYIHGLYTVYIHGL